MIDQMPEDFIRGPLAFKGSSPQEFWSMHSDDLPQLVRGRFQNFQRIMISETVLRGHEHMIANADGYGTSIEATDIESLTKLQFPSASHSAL